MDGIDEAGLERLVHPFYARVREDAELGPIFNGAIADWPEHLARLTAFWSSVMLTSGRYKGQPEKQRELQAFGDARGPRLERGGGFRRHELARRLAPQCEPAIE